MAFNFFELDMDLRQSYMRELKHLIYKCTYNEPRLKEQPYAPLVFAGVMEKYILLKSQGEYNLDTISSLFEASDYNFAVFLDELDPSAKVKIKKAKLSAESLQLKEDASFKEVWNYSLLYDLLEVAVKARLIEVYVRDAYELDVERNNQLVDEYDATDDEERQLELLSEIEQIRANLYPGNIIKVLTENFSENSIEHLSNLMPFDKNEVILDFIKENELDPAIAAVLEKICLCRLKFTYDNSYTDAEFNDIFKACLKKLDELNCNVLCISFTDQFVAEKYKDMLASLASKYLKAQKKYTLSKLAVSLIKADNLLGNSLTLSTMAIDMIQNKAKNQETSKVQAKIALLTRLSHLLSDCELYTSTINGTNQTELINDALPDDENIQVDRSKVRFLRDMNLIYSFVASSRKQMVHNAVKCLLPHQIDFKRIDAVVSEGIKRDFVYQCYDSKGKLRDDLNLGEETSLNMLLEESGYFSAEGYVKGQLFKLV